MHCDTYPELSRLVQLANGGVVFLGQKTIRKHLLLQLLIFLGQKSFRLGQLTLGLGE
jgi:hypothetical protein